MSMPDFPDNCLNISRQQSFNMIIASIAMEELALSHIMNAEGEKLQYVLGTLPGTSPLCSSTSEVLEVNKSITKLLDSVAQNQLMLKSKLERILDISCCEPDLAPAKSEFLCLKAKNTGWSAGKAIPMVCTAKSGDCIEHTDQSCNSIFLNCQRNYLMHVSLQFNPCADPCIIQLQDLHCGSLFKPQLFHGSSGILSGCCHLKQGCYCLKLLEPRHIWVDTLHLAVYTS